MYEMTVFAQVGLILHICTLIDKDGIKQYTLLLILITIHYLLLHYYKLYTTTPIQLQDTIKYVIPTVRQSRQFHKTINTITQG